MGCAVARLLSRYEADVALLEGASDVSEGASKANSGIVHAGFDAKPGTLKAKLNVEGARMYPALCAEVDAPYGQPGAMVLAFTEEERANIQTLYEQGVANGVEGLRVIEREGGPLAGAQCQPRRGVRPAGAHQRHHQPL